MANTTVEQLVSTFRQNLNLQGKQEQQLRDLVSAVVEKAAARRASAKQLVEQLQAAVQSNDDAAVEPLLQKVREGLRQAAQGRDAFLDQLDQVLQPLQRGQLLLTLTEKAQAAGQPAEQYLFSLLQNAANNQ